MAILPATGTTIAMGAVYAAFNFSTATQATLAGLNIKLNLTLGVNYGGKTASSTTPFSATLGGRTTPFNYYGNL